MQALAGRHRSRLGVFAPDRSRSILVSSSDGEMAVALHERIDRTRAVIKDVRPDESADGIAACLPFPWLVINAAGGESAALEDVIRRQPVLALWRAPTPRGLPRHVRAFTRFSEVSAAVEQALMQRVAGLRLAGESGVDLADGTHIASAVLQALVAQHPLGFDLPPRLFAGVPRTLAAHHVQARLVRGESRGGSMLVADAAAH